MNTNARSESDLIHEDNERMLAEAREKAKLRVCSFCGKDENNVPSLIAGMTAFICGECVQICADIVLKHLWDKATRLKDAIKGMEQHGGIPPITGVSEQEIPVGEG